LTPPAVRRRQTLERKAAFIAQVTRGDLPDRDVDDIGDQALSFAEVKALATGDPLVLEKASVDADVARLTRLERSHHDDQHRLRRTLAAAQERAARADERVGQLTAALDRLTDTHGDRFTMTVDGRDYTRRGDAGDALQRLLSDRLTATPLETVGPAVKIGTLGSLPVTGQAITTIADEIRLGIADAHIELTYRCEEWQHADPAMIVGRLERHLQRVPDTIAATKAEAQAAIAEATRAEARIGQPFEHSSHLRRTPPMSTGTRRSARRNNRAGGCHRPSSRCRPSELRFGIRRRSGRPRPPQRTVRPRLGTIRRNFTLTTYTTTIRRSILARMSCRSRVGVLVFTSDLAQGATADIRRTVRATSTAAETLRLGDATISDGHRPRTARAR
jgi:outer membrane murein-binding lipoprotein Lpp